MADLSTLSQPARNLLAQVQNLFGADNVTVTSAGRSASHNATIPGASKTSAHIGGNAFDFKVTGMDPMKVQDKIAQAGLGYGQSIAEYGLGMGPRNHLSAGNKGENLVARNGDYQPRKLGDSLRDKVTGWAKVLLDDTLVDAAGGGYDLATGKKTVGETVAGALDYNGWFSRIVLAFFALLILAAALFMLGRNELPSIPGVK